MLLGKKMEQKVKPENNGSSLDGTSSSEDPLRDLSSDFLEAIIQNVQPGETLGLLKNDQTETYVGEIQYQNPVKSISTFATYAGIVCQNPDRSDKPTDFIFPKCE